MVLQPGEEGIDATITKLSFAVNKNNSVSPYFVCAQGTWVSEATVFRSLIKFDLSNVDIKDFVKANLFLFGVKDDNFNRPGHLGDNEAGIYKITQPWQEDKVTWENQPKVDYDNPLIIPKTKGLYEDVVVDVTGWIKEFLADSSQNYGFYLKLLDEEKYSITDNNFSRDLGFASSDYYIDTLRPKLVIEYVPSIDTVKIEPLAQVKVYNFVSPNGDNHNEFLTIKNIQLYPENKLTIFDKWGNNIFHKIDYDNSWNGNNLPNGIYYYILKLNSNQTLKGELVIKK